MSFAINQYSVQKNYYGKYALGTKNSTTQKMDFDFMGAATSLTNSSDSGKGIGITTVGNRGYIARYADTSTDAEPVIKVGDYEVRINDVNPNNATKMEMFALMSYMDDKGLIGNSGIKSFNKMTAYAAQAEYNGYCSGISDENKAWSYKQNWIGILNNAKETFLKMPQTYEQGLNCQRLIDGLEKYAKTSASNYSFFISDRADGTQAFDRTLMGMTPDETPSFVEKVWTKEELFEAVDKEVQSNQYKKKSFRFAGEDKIYSFYDFMDEFEKRSAQNR